MAVLAAKVTIFCLLQGNFYATHHPTAGHNGTQNIAVRAVEHIIGLYKQMQAVVQVLRFQTQIHQKIIFADGNKCGVAGLGCPLLIQAIGGNIQKTIPVMHRKVHQKTCMVGYV